MVCFSVVTKGAAKILIEGSAPAPLEKLDQVHELVRQINLFYSRLPLITPDEIIARSFLLTKGDPTNLEIAEAFLFFRMRELSAGKLSSEKTEFWHVEGIAERTDLMQGWWKEIKSDRYKFRNRLDELLLDRVSACEKHQTADTKVLRKYLTVIPQIDDASRTVVRYFPKTTEAAYTLVLALLYKNNFEKLACVQTCAWDPCSAYFLRKASNKGGRPKLYCSSVCQKKPDQKRALVRQAQEDQRKKQRERRRKYRKEGKK